MSEQKSLPEILRRQLEVGVERMEDGALSFPTVPAFAIDQEGSNILAAIDNSTPEPGTTPLPVRWGARMIVEGCREVIYGQDRYCREGQGTTLSDVFTFWWFRRDPPVGEESWVTGIIEYGWDEEAGAVKFLPTNYDNPFWNEVLRREAKPEIALALRMREAP